MWDGGTARQLGLVDGFGGMSEAIAKAGDLAHLDKDNRGIRYLEQPKSFRDQLLDALAPGGDDSSTSEDAFGMLASQPGRQLARRSPRCARSSPAPASRRAASNARGRACARFDQPRRELARDGGEMAVLIRATLRPASRTAG